MLNRPDVRPTKPCNLDVGILVRLADGQYPFGVA